MLADFSSHKWCVPKCSTLLVITQFVWSRMRLTVKRNLLSAKYCFLWKNTGYNEYCAWTFALYPLDNIYWHFSWKQKKIVLENINSVYLTRSFFFNCADIFSKEQTSKSEPIFHQKIWSNCLCFTIFCKRKNMNCFQCHHQWKT